MKKAIVIIAAVAALAAIGPAFAGEGEALFKSRCAPCHGNNGKGSSAAPPLRDNEFVGRASESELSGLIANGLPGEEKRFKEYPLPMPGFDFSDEEMKAVTEHLKSIAKK
ncbi:MAG: cytochrome c [Deltaproteobacteria bacterium]|nr:cytochrome c [Deltaproteobacteria bacterium]